MRIFYDSDVLEELIFLSGYIHDNNEETAQRFLDACDAAFHFLAQNKYAGARKSFSNPELQLVRMWRVKGFENHLIFTNHLRKVSESCMLFIVPEIGRVYLIMKLNDANYMRTKYTPANPLSRAEYNRLKKNIGQRILSRKLHTIQLFNT